MRRSAATTSSIAPRSPFEAEAAFDAAARCVPRFRRAVDAHEPDAARGNHADTRMHRNPQIGRPPFASQV